MVRTQIQLSEEQAKRLREISLERHESVASLIRKAVDLFLNSGRPGRTDLYRQAAAVVGKYETAESDVAVNHDRYLDEDFEL
ncbi:MAG: CopG family transcriptional regulator [Candidatus Aminicenantes bacterium]|nr:CopG family transcriptional regulator [Candidatus Aminicenantes bacterium]